MTSTTGSSTSSGSTSLETSTQTTNTTQGTDSTGTTVPTGSTGSTGSTGDPPGLTCSDHENYEVAFSTYFGGAEDWENTRGISVGPDGSIYITGGTASKDFPTTPGAYDTTYNGGGGQVGNGGDIDAFVAKFTPDGQLEWSTFFGGPNYDRAYTVRVDADGYVYIGGRAGPGLPVTNGAFQTTYKGFNTGFYGQQNGFIAKLSPDGSNLEWASYVGVGALVRTFDIDDSGDIYASLSIENKSPPNQPAWMSTAFDNAFQKTPGSSVDNGVVKIMSDGSQVLWASWLGGNGDERPRSTVRVDAQKRPYVLVPTSSDDLLTTPEAWSSSYMGNEDLYLARLSADGSTLEMATYIGGTEHDEIETHGLGIADDSVYVGFYTQSMDLETTPGAFQQIHGGGNNDTMIARLDLQGGLMASTYLGGDGGDGCDGFEVTPSGDVVVVGESNSTNYPTTPDAMQLNNAGGIDGTIARLSPDLTTLVYGSYAGSPGRDNIRSATIDGECSVMVAGSTDSSGFPTVNAIQPDFAGGPGDYGSGDNILIRLNSIGG